MSIEFVELPQGHDNTRKRGRELRAFAEVLQANPGRWAKYPIEVAAGSVHQRSYAIRRGQLAAFPAGEFDATVREGVVYVRAVNPA